MSRTPFDAAYTRRPARGGGAGGGAGAGSLMGSYPGQGSRGGEGYDYDEVDHYGGGGGGGSGYGGGEPERIPRSKESGGWRKRSPSPGQMEYYEDRYVERDPGHSGGRSMYGGGDERRYGFRDPSSSSRHQMQVYEQQQTHQVLGNPVGAQQPTLMVLQPSMRMGHPFVPTVQSMVIPAAFGQPVFQQGGSFGPGFGSSSSSASSLYGPQTQHGFSGPRNLISSSDERDHDRGRRGRGRDRGRRSSPGRNDSLRKRGLVARDPRPDEGKKARFSSEDRKKPDVGMVKRTTLNTGSSNRRRPTASKPKKVDDIAKEKANEAERDKKAKGKDDKKEGEKSSEKKDNEKERNTDYDEIPSSLLACKVCQKSMNDGQSFSSHLTGRAHQSLMKMLEERFAKRSELLMNESKCAEEEIGIEMDRQRRAGSSKGGRPDKTNANYCKMCDCHYVTNWGNHKVSVGHRILKEFLHPSCHVCKAPFMHRKDWVVHLLSAPHMKKLKEIKDEGTNAQLVEEFESTFQDQLFTVHVDLARDERPVNSITVKALDGREALTEEMKEILKNDRGEIVLPTGEIALPKEYNPELMVGADAVVSINGSRCRVCRVYIPEDKDADEHCQSREHYNQYVSFLKRVNKHREHKERERKEAEERARREEERLKRRAEEQEKAATGKTDALVNGEEVPNKNEGTTGTDEMEVDQEGTQPEEKENKVIEMNELESEEKQNKGMGGEDEIKAQDNTLTRDAKDEEQDQDAEIIEGDSGFAQFLPVHEAVSGETEETATAEIEEDQQNEEDEERLPIAVSGGSEVQLEGAEEQTINEDSDGEEEHPDDEVEEIQEASTPHVLTPSKTRGRGRGRGARRSVSAKVDTGIRGRGRGTAIRSRPTRGHR